ncbi:MAG: divalent-cation tolerance protein CutA [Acidobacteriaceae bacterium]|nr:divalent-cation tolerance protein CutA [Acidobacteriaceae bacterium]
MTDALVVLSTFSNEKDALRIGSALVEARLAACVNVLPTVRSIYRWKGEIEHSDESLLLIKTTRQVFPALRDRLKEMHSYQTPEIVAVPIVDGLFVYLDWLTEQVS